MTLLRVSAYSDHLQGGGYAFIIVNYFCLLGISIFINTSPKMAIVIYL